MARPNELKAAAAKARPSAPSLPPMPKDGVRERVALYEEDLTDAKGRRFDGSVIWRTEKIKTNGKPDELAARADVEIPSRGLRMTMSLKRNLDPALPASHVVELTIAVSGDFDGGGVANVPGILMKANERVRPSLQFPSRSPTDLFSLGCHLSPPTASVTCRCCWSARGSIYRSTM
jgi:hypothetical protein